MSRPEPGRPSPAAPRRPALWVDVALTLALITLVAVVLNAGLFWLGLRQAMQEERVAAAEQVASYVAAALEAEARANPDEPRYRQALAHFKERELAVTELYVVSPSLSVLASWRGEPPRALDAGFRSAFFSREPHVAVDGRLSTRPSVVVTWPIAPVGPAVAALRIAVPLGGGSLLASRSGFLLVYVLFTGAVLALSGYVLLRRRLVVPIQQLRRGTARIASGDFAHRVEIDAAAELVALTESLNHLAASLQTYQRHTGEQVGRLEEANRALALAQDELVRSARLASVGQLAAGIAHEVGNPLAAVVGYIDLLRGECRDDERELVGELLERTAWEIDRIHHILRELIDYARPSGEERGEALVDMVLRDTLATVGYQAIFRSLRVDIVLPAELPPVAIRPGRLHQILVNLLLNAADAMEGDGRLEVRASAAEGEVLLSVRDSGPGLSTEVQEHLFEPFYTTKSGGRGVGLGLATSLALVERVGGRLTGENHPDGGAWFLIALPVARPTLAARPDTA